MKKFCNIALSAVLFLAMTACTKEKEKEIMEVPATEITVEQLSSQSAKLCWTPADKDAAGQYVFVRTEVSSFYSEPVATLEGTASEYVFDNLEQGNTYWFGIQSFRSGNALSKLIYTDAFYLKSQGELNYIEGGAKVATPSYAEAEQTGSTKARLHWEATTDASKYYIYSRKSSEKIFTKVNATVEKGLDSYDYEGLEFGSTYVFGVQAVGSKTEENAPIVVTDSLKMVNMSNAPEFTIKRLYQEYAYLGVDYVIDGVNASNPERGLCVSGTHIPDAETPGNWVFRGPQGKTGLQVIPVEALPSIDSLYRVRPFVKVKKAYWYGPVQYMKLQAQPDKIVLEWESVSGLDIPESVKVFKTKEGTKLEGRPLNAWYAIADCHRTGDVEFRVLDPGSLQTIDKQAQDAGDCYVLINGGIYGGAGSGYQHLGLAISDGKFNNWQEEMGARVWQGDKDQEEFHYITRATFGTDKQGEPRACFSHYSAQDEATYYDAPLTSIAEEPMYAKPEDDYPYAPISWRPRQAIATGPMVLYNNNVCVDLKTTQREDGKEGFAITNYELWGMDEIYLDHPDRTAVGYTEDGKIVLFICDGRIEESSGATMPELGRIMKGLGCVSAMNLDGGGSTGMWANGGGHLNSLRTSTGSATETNRPVRTTLGFFAKR